jgi:pimeloyl-ACP methyl ester carboxylesterase
VNKWAAELDPPALPPTEEERRLLLSRPRTEPPAYIEAGLAFSLRTLSETLAREDLPKFATRFAVPIVFIQGSDDLLTTTAVVRTYFSEITAPSKQFIELPHAGHLAIFRDRHAFLDQLIEHVRPLAVSAQK